MPIGYSTAFPPRDSPNAPGRRTTANPTMNWAVRSRSPTPRLRITRITSTVNAGMMKHRPRMHTGLEPIFIDVTTPPDGLAHSTGANARSRLGSSPFAPQLQGHELHRGDVLSESIGVPGFREVSDSGTNGHRELVRKDRRGRDQRPSPDETCTGWRGSGVLPVPACDRGGLAWPE